MSVFYKSRKFRSKRRVARPFTDAASGRLVVSRALQSVECCIRSVEG